MELEVSNHKRADLTNLRKVVKKIVVPLLGITLSISLFSGCGLKNVYASTESGINEQSSYSIQSDLVVIPSEFQTYFSYYNYEMKSSYTLEELKQIKILDITVRDDSDLSWINSCVNLESLSITLHSNGDNLKQIGNLKNLKKVSLHIMPTEGYNKNIDVNNLEFIKNNKTIDTLLLGDSMESGNNQNIFNYICDENNIKNLSLNLSAEDNIDFTKMESLENLDLNNSKPYDLAITLNNQVINTLKNNKVNIFANDGVLEKTYEINKELDNIVNYLNINKYDTDKEKMDAILIYILDNFSYDEQVSNNSRNNIKDYKLNQSFYTEGALDAVFNKNGNIICGNYAALFKALANRVGLDSYYMLSENHAWNLVSVEGDYYYVDATWLDGKTFSHITFDMETRTSKEEITTAQDKIRSGETNDLNWYMMHLDKVVENDSNFSHESVNFPNDIQFNNGITNDDISGKEFKINIGAKEYIITGAILIGILCALGLAKKVKNKNKVYNYEEDYSSGKTFI